MVDKIQLEKASKRFKQDWIFRNLSLELNLNDTLAILGANGSGKSTLLQSLSGLMSLSAGDIFFYEQNKTVEKDFVFQSISLATPYQELIEEFTLLQMIEFHAKFKSFRKNLSIKDVVTHTELEIHQHKMIKNFSSGMKQRLKLALAILTESTILLIDEPCSNLDSKAKNWYRSLIESNLNGRITVVCSNHQQEEYSFCKRNITIEDYKLR